MNHAAGGYIIKKKPDISVVMPAYKGSEHFPDAINSILNQSLENLELIIVLDPHPNDKCITYLSNINDERIKLVRNYQRFGLVRSRNIALNISSGEYIAVMDSDDISLPKRMELEYSFLNMNKDYNLVGTNAIIIDNDGEIKRMENVDHTEEEIYYNLHFANQFPHSSVMMKRRDIISVGGYDESYDFGEDYHLFLKLMRKGRFYKMKTPLIKWRDHSESVSKEYEDEEEDRIGTIIQENYINRYGYHFDREIIKSFRDHSKTDIHYKETLVALKCLEHLNSSIIKQAPRALDKTRLASLSKIKMNSYFTGQLLHRRLVESSKLVVKRLDLIPSLIDHWIHKIL